MSLAPSAPSTALPLLRLGLALTAAVAFALDAEPFHRYLRAVAITPELLQTEAPPGYLRVTAYTLLGFVLLLIAAQRRLGARSLHVALGIGFLLVLVPNLLASFSAPHYGVDSVSYTRYATGLLLEGKHPYADFEAADALQRYPVRDTAVTYTNDGRLMNVFNYPPGSFLILAPLYVLGDIDPRWLYGLAFFFIAAMLLWRAPPSLRPLALGFLGFHQFFALWAVPSGVAEPLWMALLLVAWLLRDRPVLGGAVLGLALAVKQFAWFFYPYYLIIEYRERGLRAAIQAGAIGAGVFALANLPFLATDPAAWLEGITAPLTQPLPPIGIGIARWATLAFPDVPKMAYTLLVGGGIIAALGIFWRWGGRYPALTFVLPWLPLWFSWRCLSAYFYLMPLMVLFVFFEQWRKDDTAVAAQSTAPLLLPLSLLLASPGSVRAAQHLPGLLPVGAAGEPGDGSGAAPGLGALEHAPDHPGAEPYRDRSDGAEPLAWCPALLPLRQRAAAGIGNPGGYSECADLPGGCWTLTPLRCGAPTARREPLRGMEHGSRRGSFQGAGSAAGNRSL